ncbi:MAG: hypothetical protein WAN51_12815, partial [Alphaproteobacteria bacterium]
MIVFPVQALATHEFGLRIDEAIIDATQHQSLSGAAGKGPTRHPAGDEPGPRRDSGQFDEATAAGRHGASMKRLAIRFVARTFRAQQH